MASKDGTSDWLDHLNNGINTAVKTIVVRLLDKVQHELVKKPADKPDIKMPIPKRPIPFTKLRSPLEPKQCIPLRVNVDLKSAVSTQLRDITCGACHVVNQIKDEPILVRGLNDDCAICLDAKAEVLLPICRHAIYCKTCYDKLLR
jgi:hypothetical protein